MQQHYDILGISPGASVDEIKKAYRKLAKKYHPDVNRSMQASSRFVQIHESYNILLGKQTIQSPKEADYWDDYDEEYELRKKVWEYVKQQRLEKEQELQVTMNKLFYYFNLLLAAAFIFNLALIFDYSLPYDTVEDRFVKVSWAGSNGDQDDFDAYRKAGGEITLSTADHNYEINVSAGFGLQVADDETVITHTSIFNKVMSATATNFKNEKVLLQPSISVYHGFIYLIPAMLLASLIYYFLKNDNPNKITFSIILVFIIIYQLYIFFAV